ncbi:MAG: redoxin domain-containing protein [Bdellovibrionota bacterium]
MGTNPRLKWYAFAICLMGVCTGGLMLGKAKEHDYLGGLYERHDFTLLDDENEFFHLAAMPTRTLALLVFTPDGIPVNTVKPMYDFGQHLDDLRNQGIETYLVSRTSKDIVRNFKRAARLRTRVLLDVGGTVARNAGAWDGVRLVSTWAYALVDKNFHVLWLANSDQPMEYTQLIGELRKAR